ncbi:unnamed protein product [Gongylonema pulchrum]|uniref:Bromo domain-containing protein n=1 Tax=Gongylonema pulchrum TaxID=637853 RepID=A0A183E3N1_9BILA|nr:unnamed protein product [Gongylonema pulchrum]
MPQMQFLEDEERKDNATNAVSRRRRTAVCWSECFPHRQRRLRNQSAVDDTDEVDVSDDSVTDSSFTSDSASDRDASSDDVSSDDDSDSDYVITTRRSAEEEEEVEDGNLPLRESSATNCESSRSTFLPTDYADDQPGPSNVKAAPLNVSELISFIDDNASSVSDSPFSEQPSSAAFPDDSDDEAKVDFPRWMRLTQPLRFPYVAQLEDEVVYFRQGHEFYLNAVETRGLYYVTPRLRPLAHLNAEEFCIVEEVKYLRKPYRLIALKLAQTSAAGVRTGLVFSVKYHDMENVPDFIILRHLYDESVAHRYQPGTRIETILDNHWWTGTIDKKEVHDEENYPRSNWYCLTVRWDTGEDEKMSPWDVQPLLPHRRSGIASEEDQVLFSQYPVDEQHWRGAVKGIRACSDRIIEAIKSLENDPDIKPFTAPVSLVEYPDYLWDVDYPIDLSTIRQRVENRFYRYF